MCPYPGDEAVQAGHARIQELQDHVLENGICHVLNRGNFRMNVFEKADDFQSFIKLLEEGRQRSSMRILGTA